MSYRIAPMAFLAAVSYLAAVSLSLPSFAKENPSQTIDFEVQGTGSKNTTIAKGKTDIFATCYGLDTKQFAISQGYSFDISWCRSPAAGIRCTVNQQYEVGQHCICTSDEPKSHTVTIEINDCNKPE